MCYARYAIILLSTKAQKKKKILKLIWGANVIEFCSFTIIGYRKERSAATVGHWGIAGDVASYSHL